MRNLKVFSIAAIFALAILVMQGCSFSTANISSFKVGKDKAVTSEATSFKPGDTIYGNAVISNNPGKVTVKMYLVDSKGATLPGSDVSVNLPSDGTATYNLPLPESFEPGSYKLNADMINENNEKKDSKSVNITIAE